MRVVVASRNPVKIGATTQAFKTLFPDAILDMTSVNVDSGAGDQPDSDEATRRGSRTRALRSREVKPDADFRVGLEGGVGDISDARSTTLPLPPAVKKLVASGLELGEANGRVFSTANSKQDGGAYGLLTDGLYTREGIYAQTLIIAWSASVLECQVEALIHDMRVT